MPMCPIWGELSLPINALGVPKKIARSFEIFVDYQAISTLTDQESFEHDGDEFLDRHVCCIRRTMRQEKTKTESGPATVRLCFANMAIVVSNLPKVLVSDMEKLFSESEVRGAFSNDNADDISARAQLENSWRVAVPLSDKEFAPTQIPPTTYSGGTRLRADLYETAVSPSEIVRLKSVVSFVRTQIVLRFVARITARLFTSLLFLSLPLVATFGVGRSSYSPGFIPLSGGSSESTKQIVVAIALLSVDIVDAFYLTRLYLQHSENLPALLKYVYAARYLSLFGRCLYDHDNIMGCRKVWYLQL